MVDLVVFDPAGDDEEVVVGVDVDDVGAVTVYQFLPVAWKRLNVFRDMGAAIADNLTFGYYSSAANAYSQHMYGTNVVNTDSAEYGDTDNVTVVAMVILPGPGGKAKAGKLLFKGFVKHGIDQAITRGVKPRAILDALRNPLKTTEIVYDKLGRPSYKVVGKWATLAINPVSGKVVSVYPTSSRIARKFGW